jgi:hypothetical protein
MLLLKKKRDLKEDKKIESEFGERYINGILYMNTSCISNKK